MAIICATKRIHNNPLLPHTHLHSVQLIKYGIYNLRVRRQRIDKDMFLLNLCILCFISTLKSVAAFSWKAREWSGMFVFKSVNSGRKQKLDKLFSSD